MWERWWKSCAPIEGREEILESRRQEGQRIYFAIWANTFCNLDKYISTVDKWIWQCGQINVSILANTFGKYVEK